MTEAEPPVLDINIDQGKGKAGEVIEIENPERRRRRSKQPPGEMYDKKLMIENGGAMSEKKLAIENGAMSEKKFDIEKGGAISEKKFGIEKGGAEIEKKFDIVNGGAEIGKKFDIVNGCAMSEKMAIDNGGANNENVGAMPEKKKPRGKAKTKAKAKAKTKTRAKTMKKDDSDEGGEDDSDDVVKNKPDVEPPEMDEEDNKAEDGEQEKKPNKRKRAEKGEPKLGSKRRDQSKNKKLTEVFEDLPEDIQKHVAKLNRSEKTEFVEQAILREGGHLKVDTSAMYRLMSMRDEEQKGMQGMKGFGYEDQS